MFIGKHMWRTKDRQWHAHQYKHTRWIYLPPFFLRCYLCLSPVLLTLAHASESSLLTKEYASDTHIHKYTYTHFMRSHTLRTHIQKWYYIRRDGIWQKEVSKCVFKHTLYLDSFPLRLRSVYLLWIRNCVHRLSDDNEHICAILFTTSQ